MKLSQFSYGGILGGQSSGIIPLLYFSLACLEQVPSLWTPVSLPAPSASSTTNATVFSPWAGLYLVRAASSTGGAIPLACLSGTCQGPVLMLPPLRSLPGLTSDSFLGALLVATQMFIINCLPTLSYPFQTKPALRVDLFLICLCHLVWDQGPSVSSLNTEHILNWLEKWYMNKD